MREGKPSFTAEAVAAARALTGVDAVAPGLLDAPLSWVVRAGLTAPGGPFALNVATAGLLDHIELRTRAIDTALREGIAAGASQLVVLGAGLDARAWRMPELAQIHVFEVDHPSTQAAKRARIGDRAAFARRVTFAAVDFARDSLVERLAAAGHDPAAPTFWIWEGVTPYLPLEATRATLAAVASRCAPGSRLAVTYGTPLASVFPPAVTRVALLGFEALGERILGLLSTAEMRLALEGAGLRVLDDASPRDWAARYGRGRPRLLVVEERLAVAISDAQPRASRAA